MDMRDIERAAREQGWRVERTAKGHVRFVPPDPTMPIVVASGTPGDRRAIRNLLAALRRSGLVWPWPPAAARP